MRPLLLFLSVLPLLVAPAAGADDPAPAGAGDPVGRIAAVEGKVEAVLNGTAREVEKGEAIYQGDWIETGKDGRARVELNDETELVVGPSSRVHVDEFVYDPGSDKGKVLFEVGVGIVRFTTGVLESESYEVKTPVASIGVRGTIFDVIVAAIDFATTVIVYEGLVELRSRIAALLVQSGKASDVPNAGAAPSEPREPTEAEKKQSEDVSTPFKSERNTKNRPNVPTAVTKPTIPNTPKQPSSPGNIPSYNPSNRPSGPPRGGRNY